jgi:hypothetical protein
VFATQEREERSPDWEELLRVVNELEGNQMLAGGAHPDGVPSSLTECNANPSLDPDL